MSRLMIAAAALAAVFIVAVLALVVRYRTLDPEPESAADVSSASEAPAPAASPAPIGVAAAPASSDASDRGFLYGRVTTLRGTSYEGRIRWGAEADQEAFWGDYFNGAKDQNPWIAELPEDRRPRQHKPINIFGLQIGDHERPVARLFMARFGDIARVEGRGREVHVTLKSGTTFELNRFDASDFDDGLTVWDPTHGKKSFDPMAVRSIEFFPAARFADPPARLQGTVRTRQGDFTGFIEWNREAWLGTDELHGRTEKEELSLRFDTIRSIEPVRRAGSRVTLLDGRVIELDVRDAERGIYVADPRYGRVLVSWDVVDRVEFTTGDTGPAYGDFPAGVPLTGSITTKAGNRLTGKLVYDLDESETTETFDAPSRGVDFTIPFGLIAQIEPPNGPATGRVVLHNGETLNLERGGDFGESNAGMLVFHDGRSEYVPWDEVGQVDFDRPQAMYPPLGEKPKTESR